MDSPMPEATARTSAWVLALSHKGDTVRPCASEDRIQKGAPRTSFFPQKQITGRHIREGEAVFLQQRVTGRQNQRQLVAGKGFALQIAVIDRRFDHGRVKPIIQQHVFERIDVSDGCL